MHKTYIVYKGEAIFKHRSVPGGTMIISRDSESVNDGYHLCENGWYEKFIPLEEIEQMYTVIDYGLLDGKKLIILGSSDDHFDQPNSWVILGTDDKELLQRHGLFDPTNYISDKSGILYVTNSIPVSKVQILRVRTEKQIR